MIKYLKSAVKWGYTYYIFFCNANILKSKSIINKKLKNYFLFLRWELKVFESIK